MEKGRDVPYRNVLVCYNGHRQISWVTPQEYNELRKKYEINWLSVKTKEGMRRFEISQTKKDENQFISLI